MVNTKFPKTVSPDDFVALVNKCGNGTYRIGVDENLERFDSFRATIFFSGARWDYVHSDINTTKILVLFSEADGTKYDKIHIYNIESIELVRCNDLGAVYAITTGLVNQKRYLLYLYSPTESQKT